MSEGLRIRILRDSPYVPPADYQHKYGGQPTFAETLPQCDVCQRPLKLLFQFDLSDPRLGFLKLSKLDFLPVPSCVDCDLAYAGQLFYRVEGGEISILGSDATEGFENWHTACPERNVSLEVIPEDEQPSSYPSREAWEESMHASERPKHQLGGTPFWVQYEEEVACPECGSRMRLLGQVDSEVWPASESGMNAGHMFGDMGLLYAHYCDGCNILATGGQCY